MRQHQRIGWAVGHAEARTEGMGQGVYFASPVFDGAREEEITLPKVKKTLRVQTGM